MPRSSKVTMAQLDAKLRWKCWTDFLYYAGAVGLLLYLVRFSYDTILQRVEEGLVIRHMLEELQSNPKEYLRYISLLPRTPSTDPTANWTRDLQDAFEDRFGGWSKRVSDEGS